LALSSAKSDEVEVAEGVISSPNNDLEASDEYNGGVSVGEVPNNDIVFFA